METSCLASKNRLSQDPWPINAIIGQGLMFLDFGHVGAENPETTT